LLEGVIVMQQIGTNTYRVQTGERVTIAVTAFQVIDAATVAMDVPPIPPGPPPFQFDVTKASGEKHNGLIDYDFPDGAPATAHYTRFLYTHRGLRQFRPHWQRQRSARQREWQPSARRDGKIPTVGGPQRSIRGRAGSMENNDV
jgi:hypothetical protein